MTCNILNPEFIACFLTKQDVEKKLQGITYLIQLKVQFALTIPGLNCMDIATP